MQKAIVILALVTLAGVASAQDLVIGEIMYKDDNGGGDWIELYNNDIVPIDLTGMQIVDGDPGVPHATHPRCELAGVLNPGEIIVVVADFTDFGAVYPGVTNLNVNAFDPAGDGFGLGGGGDTIFILDEFDGVQYEMTYDDSAPWPTEPDGSGPTLLLSTTSCNDFSDAACWVAGEVGGTPGVLNGTVGFESSTWGSVKGLYR